MYQDLFNYWYSKGQRCSSKGLYSSVRWFLDSSLYDCLYATSNDENVECVGGIYVYTHHMLMPFDCNPQKKHQHLIHIYITHHYIYIIYLDLPGMRFVFFTIFPKRQKIQLIFFRIAFCLQNRLSENHETETARTKLLH